MSLSPLLVLPDALPASDGAASAPGALWLAGMRHLCAFFLCICHPFVGNLSFITCPPTAYLYLILYPACTLSLSVSLSAAPSLIPYHPRDYLSLLQSLSGPAPPVNSSFSPLLTHPACPFHVLSLFLNCCSSPLPPSLPLFSLYLSASICFCSRLSSDEHISLPPTPP